MTALTAAWMKTPRTLRELAKRLKTFDVKPELLRLKAEGHDVLQGQGFDCGSRTFYWVTQSRDTRKQKFREVAIGQLGMHDIKEYEG